jgi:hypothetical protein
MRKRDELDKTIFSMMSKLPKEEINPHIKTKILKRIENYEAKSKRLGIFISVLYRVSQATVAASIIALFVFFTSFMGKTDAPSPRASLSSSSPDSPSRALSVTNEAPRTYFDSIQPDYAYLNYVGF